ncbi:hypothetical protein NDU88_009481 [Pleurodeles waltl]|uniref:Uncharacterized protein n=1 Tax=Pleurodeles waltl TaxID=8319 RepID=A0AAV7RVC5_PLEWA|nr:hypothetical protein NDU88_009481 [Pleurodeles waltl]
MGDDSRTPLPCSALPRYSCPLTSGTGLPRSDGRQRARAQFLKWRPQLVRTRGRVLYAARPLGRPRCLLFPLVSMGGSRGVGGPAGTPLRRCRPDEPATAGPDPGWAAP